MNERFSRRDFLKLSGISLINMMLPGLIGACNVREPYRIIPDKILNEDEMIRNLSSKIENSLPLTKNPEDMMLLVSFVYNAANFFTHDSTISTKITNNTFLFENRKESGCDDYAFACSTNNNISLIRKLINTTEQPVIATLEAAGHEVFHAKGLVKPAEQENFGFAGYYLPKPWSAKHGFWDDSVYMGQVIPDPMRRKNYNLTLPEELAAIWGSHTYIHHLIEKGLNPSDIILRFVQSPAIGDPLIENIIDPINSTRWQEFWEELSFDNVNDYHNRSDRYTLFRLLGKRLGKLANVPLKDANDAAGIGLLGLRTFILKERSGVDYEKELTRGGYPDMTDIFKILETVE